MLSGDLPPPHATGRIFLCMHANEFLADILKGTAEVQQSQPQSGSSESLTPENGFCKSMRKVWEGTGELLGAPLSLLEPGRREGGKAESLWGGWLKENREGNLNVVCCSVLFGDQRLKWSLLLALYAGFSHFTLAGVGRQGSRSKRLSATCSTRELHRA